MLKFIRENRDVIKAISNVGLAGTHLVASIVVGMAIGYFLDDWLKTKPWFFFIFLAAGIIAGFKNMYLEAKKVQRDEEHAKKD